MQCDVVGIGCVDVVDQYVYLCFVCLLDYFVQQLFVEFVIVLVVVYVDVVFDCVFECWKCVECILVCEVEQFVCCVDGVENWEVVCVFCCELCDYCFWWVWLIVVQCG